MHHAARDYSGTTVQKAYGRYRAVWCVATSLVFRRTEKILNMLDDLDALRVVDAPDDLTVLEDAGIV